MNAKIILTGYMGSGKTTVGRELALQTGLPFLDLDAEIEKRAGMTISELFARYGELRFRKRERQVLEEILRIEGVLILATGGGTPCYYDNPALIRESGAVAVFLSAAVGTLVRNLSGENQRPLLDGLSKDEKTEFIAKHLFDRTPFYRTADHVVSVDGRSPAEIAAAVKQLLA